MIKIRMLVENESKKLPSKMVPQVPRINENICYLGKDYKITKVYWDLEIAEVEAVLILEEIYE